MPKKYHFWARGVSEKYASGMRGVCTQIECGRHEMLIWTRRGLLQIPMIGAAYLGFAEGDVDFWCCLEVAGIILCIIRRQ